jgi:hypothetical protein
MGSNSMTGSFPQRPFLGHLHGFSRGLPADPVRPNLPRSSSVPARRVRHQVRDGAVVMAFSAAASTGVALALLVLVTLAS